MTLFNELRHSDQLSRCIGQGTSLLEINSHTIYHENTLLVPSPISKYTNWRKLSHPALILLQRLQPWVPLTEFKVQPHYSLYFIVITHLHKCVTSFSNLHNHFPNKAWSKLQQWENKCHQWELKLLIQGIPQLIYFIWDQSLCPMNRCGF